MPTIGTPPGVNKVGVDPKSLSGPWSADGICQLLSMDSDELAWITATERGSAHVVLLLFPVAKYISPVEVSNAGEPHTPAPVQPLGAVYKVYRITPVVARIATILPRTRGQSPKDETPS
jgi:hypothetical protein